MTKLQSSLPLYSLVIANIIPLFGALFWGWGVFELVILYWVESAIIGVYNVFKMIIVGKWQSIFFVPFFILHYSGFMAGHLIFLVFIFADGLTNNNPFLLPTLEQLQLFLFPVMYAIIVLVISHGVSFVVNFLMKSEYKKINIQDQLYAPYIRIIVMHISILFAGGIAFYQGEGLALLILLILIKTATDIYAHNKRHKKLLVQDIKA